LNTFNGLSTTIPFDWPSVSGWIRPRWDVSKRTDGVRGA
jgi:hypothetical protein